MKHFTEVGRPPVEKKEGNCPHCNSEQIGQLWTCGTFRATPDNQTRDCRIFQLEAEIERLQAIVGPIEELRAEDYIILHSGTPSEYKRTQEAVEVAAEWTNGETEYFHGDTLADALKAAVDAKAAASAVKE